MKTRNLNKSSACYFGAIKYVFSMSYLKCCFLILLNMLNVVKICISLLLTETITNTFFLLDSSSSINYNLKKICVFACGLIIIRVISALKTNLWDSICAKLQLDFNTKRLKKASSVQWEYYESCDSANIMYIVKTKGITSITQCFQSFVTFIESALLIVVYCFFLARINFLAALLYLLIVVFFNIASKKFLNDMGDEWKEISILEKKEKYFLNACGGKNRHAEYVINHLHNFFYKKWDDVFNQQQQKKVLAYSKSELLNRASRIVLYVPYIIMMFAVSVQIFIGKYEIGYLFLCMDMFNEIINTVTKIRDNYSKSVVSSGYIQDIIEFNEYKEMYNQINSDNNMNAIELINASYKYPQTEKLTLKNISLTIKHGKTTLINVICGLLSLDTGQYFVCPSIGHANKGISVIYQDFIHYQLTIRENVAFGYAEGFIPDAKIWGLLELVGLKSAVEKFENGLDTNLGQLCSGTDLSKGQWQRLAIARLLANEEAGIWILDEPTAYLDPNAEVELYNLVNRLAGNRTVIYISHRLGFAKNADRIIMLENGEIVESGKHDDLLELKGEYSKLYYEQIKSMFG